MTELTNEQLQSLQAEANSTLDAVIATLESDVQMQVAVRYIMQANGAELSTFQKLMSKQPELATRLLVAAVGGLVNLQTSRAVATQLANRSARN